MANAPLRRSGWRWHKPWCRRSSPSARTSGASAGFDFHWIARFGGKYVERLLQDEGIARHRCTIEAVINNARRAVELWAEQGRWFAVRLHLALRGRTGDTVGYRIDLGQVDRAVERSEEARLGFRRPDHHARVHVGDRVGQRPRARAA